MKINLVTYGIARDLVGGSRKMTFEFDGKSLGDLRKELTLRFPDFSKLKNVSFAVAENYRTDDHPLNNGDEVVVIPPVSGG